MATLKHKLDLIRGVFDGKGTAKIGPIFVNIDLTRRCNLRCLGCRVHSRGIDMPSPGDHSVKDISFELFAKACRELKAGGTREITLIGEGEPFFHPRLADIVAEAKSSGFIVELYTNGTRFGEDIVRRLISVGLDTLKVSLWAINAEDYQKNYPGTPVNHFNRVVDGLKLVSELKRAAGSVTPKVIICHPVNRNNVKSLDALPGFAASVGADAIDIVSYRARSEVYSPFSLTDEERAEFGETLKALKGGLDGLSVKHNIDNALFRSNVGSAVWKKAPCYIGWFHARIRVDGTVVPCDNCQIPVGDMKKESFLDIWNGPAYRKFRESVSTKAGLAGLGATSANCEDCCYLQDNYKIYRVMKYIAPVVALFKKRGAKTIGEPRA